jgi:hypothetical protein
VAGLKKSLMPGFGQSLACVIDPSTRTTSLAPNVAVASPLAKPSESAARATPGSTTAAQIAARTQPIRIQPRRFSVSGYRRTAHTSSVVSLRRRT